MHVARREIGLDIYRKINPMQGEGGKLCKFCYHLGFVIVLSMAIHILYVVVGNERGWVTSIIFFFCCPA